MAGPLYSSPNDVMLLTVQQHCNRNKWSQKEKAAADSLAHVTLSNKANFARMHGMTMQVINNPVRCLFQELCPDLKYAS